MKKEQEYKYYDLRKVITKNIMDIDR